MRKVVSRNEVTHLWAHQAQQSARNSNGTLFFEGDTIYSYGYHFPIAKFHRNSNGESAVLFTTRTYSVTTSGHYSLVHRAISHVSTIFHVPLGRNGFNPIDAVVSYRERIEESQNAVAKARIERTREYAYASLTSLVEQANRFCEFFGLADRFTVLSDFDSLKSTLSKQAAEKRKAERERLAALATENAEKIQRWINGERV